MHFVLLMTNAIRSELRYKANLLGVLVALVLMYSLQFVFLMWLTHLWFWRGKIKIG